MFGDKRWYLFSVAGNPVYVTPSFLLILAMFVGMGVQTAEQLLVGLLWVPILFISILLHELGHAFASRALGYGKSQILFWGLGGLAINNYTGRRSPKNSILVSLAGPAASLILALISGAVLYVVEGGLSTTGLWGVFLWKMFSMNMFWAVFNLLPIYPMDGGQAMRSGFEMIFKNHSKATRLTGIVSIVTLIIAVVFAQFALRGLGMFTIFLALYFGYLNYKLIQGQGQRWY
ncbi:MAG: site-2 protease family protein [Myxococcota bacterium]|jgi:Zn-dependent protease|nr:site-2 protease family protein [Myxococcota bacterium]MEC9442562.1 site-2 protease family protein [Myxococcota bacterium]